MNPDSQTIDTLCSLTPAQTIALDHLVCGFTHTAAATAAGVARETVTRWISHHPGFRAALDRARWATSLETLDRISSIRMRALDLLAQHLETIDPMSPGTLTAAVTVLKAIPVVEAPTRRPEPAEALAYRDLRSIRMDLYADADFEYLFPVSIDPEHLMLDAVAE
jgi:hypothetical protein